MKIKLYPHSSISPLITPFITIWIALLPSICEAQTPESKVTHIPKSIEPFFKSYCYKCHNAKKAKGDLNLKKLTRSIADSADALDWQDILDQLNSGEMPPKKDHVRKPSDRVLSLVVGDLTKSLQSAQDILQDSGAEIVLRRLNNREYAATIKDLTGINLDASKLPNYPSGRFDTIGKNQTLSALQLEQHFSFAQEVARMSLYWAKKPRKKSKVIIKQSLANSESRSKHIYEMMKKVKLVKEKGMTPTEAGLTKEEWLKYDTDGPNNQNVVWKWQTEYYQRNLAHHSKGRVISNNLLVSSVPQYTGWLNLHNKSHMKAANSQYGYDGKAHKLAHEFVKVLLTAPHC